jgi:glyoxylase-like metal-dependent hydrolase (beta-lactamase superfamily II)
VSTVRSLTDDILILEEEMRPGWFLSVIVVFGENKIGVIDTGFEETPEKYVFPLILEHGRNLDEVDLVVNTHRDGDHVRGNNAFIEKTDACIAIHKMEVEAVPNVDIQLDDGSRVELGDRIFKVIHTPGHRPGSICLYDSNDKFLITGDSVCGTREDLIRMDKSIYIDSLQKLLKYDLETMIMSHPFKPPGKNVLLGEEIKKFIKDSIEIARNL